MNKQTAKTVMPIIAVDSVDEPHRFYTERLGFSRVMGVVGKDGQFDFVSVVLVSRVRDSLIKSDQVRHGFIDSGA